LRKNDVEEEDALRLIEAHRSQLGRYGEMPSPLNIYSYIEYRTNIDHQDGIKLYSHQIEYATNEALAFFS
jgi:hypothetical protein